MFTLRTFGPASWSRPDLRVLLPGLFAGLALGWLVFEWIDPRIVALGIGTISLSFALHWFWKRHRRAATAAMPVQAGMGFLAGAASGFTTFVAHAGGPPLAVYLMRRDLGKTLFVGTTAAFFTLGNLLKLGPYGMMTADRPDALAGAILLAPIVPVGVWLGLRLHHRLSYEGVMLATNLLLVLGGARLVWQALGALLR